MKQFPKRLKLLLIGENFPPAAIGALSRHHQVFGIHPYIVKDILRSEHIDAILIPIRSWLPTYFAGRDQWQNTPRIILLKDHLDKLSDKHILTWDEPYTAVSFLELFDFLPIPKDEEYEVIFRMSNRKLVKFNIGEILVVRKQPQGQLLVCTSEGDHLIYGSLNQFLQLLPEKKFERVSDGFIIPVSARKHISRKGFCFRGGYLPITTKFKSFQKNSQLHEDLI